MCVCGGGLQTLTHRHARATTTTTKERKKRLRKGERGERNQQKETTTTTKTQSKIQVVSSKHTRTKRNSAIGNRLCVQILRHLLTVRNGFCVCRWQSCNSLARALAPVQRAQQRHQHVKRRSVARLLLPALLDDRTHLSAASFLWDLQSLKKTNKKTS